MEEPKKACNNDQERKKIVKKMGGGGGVGAVLLLGGALATAALASVFVVRKRRKESRRRSQSPGLSKQNEEGETNKGLQLIFLDSSSNDVKHRSSGARKEVESDSDVGLLDSDKSLKLGDVNDAEESHEQILCKEQENEAKTDGSVITNYSSVKKVRFELENMVDDDVKIEPNKEDENVSKGMSNFVEQVCIGEEMGERKPDCTDGQIQGMHGREPVEVPEMQTGEKEESVKVCCYEEEREEIPVDVNGAERVDIDEMEAKMSFHTKLNIVAKESEACCIANGEMEEKTEVIPQKIEDVDPKDGSKTVIPVFERFLVELENVNGEKKEGALPTEVAGFRVQNSEDIEGGLEYQLHPTEEQLVEEHEEFDRPDDELKCVNSEKEDCPPPLNEAVEGRQEDRALNHIAEQSKEDIVIEKCEEGGEANPSHHLQSHLQIELSEGKFLCDNKQDNLGDYDDSEQIVIMPMPKNDMVSHEDGVGRNTAKEVEDSSVKIETENDDLAVQMSGEEEGVKDKIKADNEEVDAADLSDEIDEISVATGDSSAESNAEAIWPAESNAEAILPAESLPSIEPQKVKLIDLQVQVEEGSSFESPQPKAEESNENSAILDDSDQCHAANGNSEKASVMKYEADQAQSKNHIKNSNRWRITIGILSVLSSISCSWFFGLSFVKLCLIMFFTFVLSEMHRH